MISTYTEGPPQVDGRRYVTERHVDDTGKVYDFEWLGAQDVGLVLSARAALLDGQITAQREAQALVLGTRLPWTKLQFERRFTDAEWSDAQDFNAGFEFIPQLSSEQKLTIRRGLNDYKIALDVSPTDPGTIALVSLYEAFGVIAPGRAAEVLNG